MQKIIAVTLGISLLSFLSGCILVPLGLMAGGVVGGIAISEDTVEAAFDRSYNQVWDASVEVVDKAGAVESEDRGAGTIQGLVRKTKVTVKLEQLTPATVRVRVKARKWVARFKPDIKTADKIAYRIGQVLQEVADPVTSQSGR
jgi:hypothetical protein